MRYWISSSKSDVDVRVIRSMDESGVVKLQVEWDEDFTASFIPSVPHYEKPDIHLDENGRPKKARVVMNHE